VEAAEPRDLPRLSGEGAEVVLDRDLLSPEGRSSPLNGSNVGDPVASSVPQRGVMVSPNPGEPG
jgi:hypothetical protein